MTRMCNIGRYGVNSKGPTICGLGMRITTPHVSVWSDPNRNVLTFSFPVFLLFPSSEIPVSYMTVLARNRITASVNPLHPLAAKCAREISYPLNTIAAVCARV